MRNSAAVCVSAALLNHVSAGRHRAVGVRGISPERTEGDPQMCEISIITPVYKAELFLDRCVSSIQAQTLAGFELLLADDGSADRSGALCDQYALEDERIVVLHQPNQGQAAARNRALELVSGKYIGFVDSDDWVHPEMYRILVENAEKNRASISVGGYRSVTEYRQPEALADAWAVKVWGGRDFLKHGLLDGVDKKPWVLWDKVFSSACFQEIRMPEGRINEDNAVVYKLLYGAERVADCDAPLYAYYQNPDSTMNAPFSRKQLDWLLVPQEMIRFFAEYRDEELLDKANRMYLYALDDLYRKVRENLRDRELERKLKKELKAQYQRERSRYPITITSHPQVIESLHPFRARIYWSAKALRHKRKGSC